MPRSIARFRIALALSSSLYMRNRLPQPKARIETFAPVRPKVRLGIASAVGVATAPSVRSNSVVPAAAPTPILSRNWRREISLAMDPPADFYYGMLAQIDAIRASTSTLSVLLRWHGRGDNSTARASH